MSTGEVDHLFHPADRYLERRISRWEHEAVLERVQNRRDQNPDAMGVRRQTEMSLNVPAYNMKRVIMIVGVGGLLETMRA